MHAPLSALRFPSSRVLLPRTRLAYIHLRNLLTDAKRDRSARISGYVAIAMPEELVTLFLLGGELVNATVRNAHGSRAVAIAAAVDLVPPEPEYGEITFCEAEVDQLAAMFTAQSAVSEAWPAHLNVQDPAALFPYLMSTTFDGVVEIAAGDAVNYLIFRDGAAAHTYLAHGHQGSLAERVAKLFAREGRGDLGITRWSGLPAPLPIQAPAALVQAYRELAAALVQRLLNDGRDGAPMIAEQARLKLVAAHPVLDGFSFSERPAHHPLADTEELTCGVAAWIREVMWAAIDHEAMSPEAILRDLTWERRHMFQSAGLYEQMPWRIV